MGLVWRPTPVRHCMGQASMWLWACRSSTIEMGTWPHPSRLVSGRLISPARSLLSAFTFADCSRGPCECHRRGTSRVARETKKGLRPTKSKGPVRGGACEFALLDTTRGGARYRGARRKVAVTYRPVLTRGRGGSDSDRAAVRSIRASRSGSGSDLQLTGDSNHPRTVSAL